MAKKKYTGPDRRLRVRFKMEVKPSLPVADRRSLEHVLQHMGYVVGSGFNHPDNSSSDITFEEK